MHPSSSVRDDLVLLGLCWNALMHVQTVTEAPLTASLKQLSHPRSPVTAPGEGCLQRLALATLYTSPPFHFLPLPLSRTWLTQLSSQPDKLPSMSDCFFLQLGQRLSFSVPWLFRPPSQSICPSSLYSQPTAAPQAEKRTEDMQNPVEVGSRQGSLLGQTLGRPAGSNLLTWLSNRIHCC